MAQYEKSYGAPQIDKDEHVLVNGVNAKRVLVAGYDGTNLQDFKVTSAGHLYSTLVDENGVAYGVKQVNNKPRVSSMDYLYDIAEGNVTGHTAFAISNGAGSFCSCSLRGWLETG